VAFEGLQAYAGTAPLRIQTPWPGGTYGSVGPGVGGSVGGFAGVYGRPLGSEAPGGSAPQPVLAPYEQRPEVEARAAVEFTQVASADLIRKLYNYLEGNSQRYRQLVDCIPMVRRAAELYGAGDYTGAFSQAYQAHRGITILRSNIPELPGL
jgi:hypothetical protein